MNRSHLKRQKIPLGAEPQQFTILLWLAAARAFAAGVDPWYWQKKSVYHTMVAEIRANQSKLPRMPIYIGGAVKRPGAYQFKGPAKIKDLVYVAGGFTVSDSSGFRTGDIFVLRPTKENPEPSQAAFSCRLNLSKLPDMDYQRCQERVQTGDLLDVIFVDKSDLR